MSAFDVILCCAFSLLVAFYATKAIDTWRLGKKGLALVWVFCCLCWALNIVIRMPGVF